ncbi:unnamed protein product [Porites lobata]|uniref:E3 ubiquitin-protein ligase TRIM71 n=1 Tax=Porites lobata TaxID=104759 RepID=A0ABN8MY00_9CNID|nr:unnamed protein product [Porites lobata]
MDIKTLLDNLHDEVSCSVCMCTFTDPKQLPCLHSFCLHCLNGIQRTSGVHGRITCPECRGQFQIPGSGNPSELPTNFRINSLLDVLAIKECSTANVKCGNCNKRSAQTLYCFQCCSFWCEECILAHNIIRTNKEHRTLALKDFRDHDIEAVLKRPAFCQKKRHEKEELKFFCKDCKVAICNTCVVTLHEGHGKMLLEEATDAHKTKINSMTKSLIEKAQEKRKDLEQLNQKSTDIKLQAAYLKSQVQTHVDQVIAIIEARKQDVFDAVDNQAKKSLESLSKKKGQVENKVKLIESAIEQTKALLKRSFSTEILGFSETFDTILQEQGTQGNRDTECIPRFSFTKSEKLMNVLNNEGIGNVKTVLSETKSQQLGAKGKESSKVIAGNKGANVRDSPLETQVQTRCFRPVLSFGQKGESLGRLNDPWGVAVNDHDEIAVTEFGNNRVSMFSSDGTHLKSFGREGQNNGKFRNPKGIAFDSHGNIVVVDCDNHRVEVFDRNGNFLSKFGEQGSLDHQLSYPVGLSVNGNGDIIVTDTGNNLIKIFSSSGEFLRKFGGAGSLVSPFHCIQHGQYFIVSDYSDHSIKMFNLEGKFISKFGKKGNKDGEFNHPRFLSVNKEGLLMVCDAVNHRVQVFELSGKFVIKFGSQGSERGEFDWPMSTANLSDGRIVVCDKYNNRIQQIIDTLFLSPLRSREYFCSSKRRTYLSESKMLFPVNNASRLFFKEGSLMVSDKRNHKVHIFELSGKFVTKFGSKGVASSIRNPVSTANIVVSCDMNNSRIQLTFHFQLPSLDVTNFILLGNLHDEVSCSVCMCTFTDPKQLPCLHSFCLHCLNGIQRTSGVHRKITCPECRRQFHIAGSGNPSELPTNFRINSLLDVLAIKECSTANVKCRNCNKRSAQTLYCFQCCSFWCDECILAHNIIRINKKHRTLALKDFQDQDIEAVLKRPAFCKEKRHENKELELFCKDCKVAICNTCAVTLHERHGKMLLEEATDARKTQINSMTQSLIEKARENRKELEQLSQKSTDITLQVADFKSQVQANVDQVIAIIEARKQDVFDAVDNQAKKSLESLSQKKDQVENHVKLIESAIEQTKALVKRSFSTEILGFSETFDTILKEQGTQQNRDTECIPRFSFTKNEKLINVLNSEGIGNVKTVSSEKKVQQSRTKGKESSKVNAGNKGANVRDRPLETQVQTRCLRSVLSFGQKGKSVGMLHGPCGLAVNGHDEIAVTEYSNHRVSVFSSDGTHLRSFGREGNNNAEFKFPRGIAFDRHGNIVVTDSANKRVQVFDRNGNFLCKFAW